MCRQTYYTSEWENKNNYPEMYLWISEKTCEKKYFVAEYAIQNHYNLGIWELKH